MKRELKFRAWDGRYFSYLDLRTDNDVDFYLFYRDIDIDSPIEQYTGLKDKNGKEIYDGDIIEVETCLFNVEKITTYVVYWSNDFLDYSLKCLKGVNYDSALGDISPSACKVIGNIHTWF